MFEAIADARLRHQRIGRAAPRQAARVVEWLGAVQAQEYGPARWGLGLRMPDGVTDADITSALDTGRILRTHLLRPTWHFVTPADIRWMLELTGPRVERMLASSDRALEIDARAVARTIAVCERALTGRRFLTRQEISHALADVGIVAKGQRLAHLVMHAELGAVICSGPRRGKAFTYALVSERAPQARRLDRDEALLLLVTRYFRSHGPATVKDCAWWSGLTMADVRRGLDMARARSQTVGGLTYWFVGGRAGPAEPTRGRVHLLPIYDEYLVAYRDRVAVPHGSGVVLRSNGAPVTFQHALVVDGQVAGTWRTRDVSEGVEIDVFPARRLTATEGTAVRAAAARYGRFLSRPTRLTIR
jgi:hypothetical protein